MVKKYLDSENFEYLPLIDDGKKLPYPVSIFFILVTEFCERFSYYGMRALLTLYMRNVLNFSENLSTTIYHSFLLLCHALPVFGGILADSYIGKYKTIIYLSTVYTIGNVVLTAASIHPLHLPIVALSLVGLMLMAIGTGGIKPCVVAMGGEQFVLPAQDKVLKQFFAVFLFAVSIGNMVATVITPILRRDISCFGESTCYPLAFGVPGILMAVAITVFIGGRCLYKIKAPDQNIFLRVMKCAVFAVKEKARSGNCEKKSHWLDYASSRYDEHLINDSKGLFRILVYYLPVPMFFALYEQLGSRWTLQATRMNGYIGGGFLIKPDQMQVANAILQFIFIPVFETVVYPLFHKCNLLNRPLQKMGVGGVLAMLSFISAGIVETKIHSTYAVTHADGDTYLNFINTISCPIYVQEQAQGQQQGQGQFLNLLRQEEVNISTSVPLHLFGFEPLTIPAKGNVVSDPISPLDRKINLQIHADGSCMNKVKVTPWKGQISLGHGLHSVVIALFEGNLVISEVTTPEDVGKSKEGNAKFRVLLSHFHNVNKPDEKIAIGINVMRGSDISYSKNLNFAALPEGSPSFLHSTLTFEVEPNTYQVAIIWKTLDNESVTILLPNSFPMGTGGSYILSVHDPSDPNMSMQDELLTLTPENQVHMLWLLPQYVLIAWAEVFFMISGMEFSFTEAPNSMKSVVQSCWHLCNAMGNVIVIITAQMNVIQMYEFFGFAALMGLDTLILCLMAMRYKYVVHGKENSIPSDQQIPDEIESKFEIFD